MAARVEGAGDAPNASPGSREGRGLGGRNHDRGGHAARRRRGGNRGRGNGDGTGDGPLPPPRPPLARRNGRVATGRVRAPTRFARSCCRTIRCRECGSRRSSARRRRRQRDDQGCPSGAPPLLRRRDFERTPISVRGGGDTTAHVVRRGRHAAHRARRRGGRDGGEAAHDPAGRLGKVVPSSARGTTTRKLRDAVQYLAPRDSPTEEQKPVKRDDVSRLAREPDDYSRHAGDDGDGRDASSPITRRRTPCAASSSERSPSATRLLTSPVGPAPSFPVPRVRCTPPESPRARVRTPPPRPSSRPPGPTTRSSPRRTPTRRRPAKRNA